MQVRSYLLSHVSIVAVAFMLPACNTLTPADKINMSCLAAETGAIVAGDITSGGAAVTSAKVAHAADTVCAALSKATVK